MPAQADATPPAWTPTWCAHHAHAPLAAGQAQVCNLHLPTGAVDQDVVTLQQKQRQKS
jgi:hypothetical protein